MTTKDLNNLIRWCCDTDGQQFAKDIYSGDEMNEYKTEKFRNMQDSTISWIASLDNGNRQMLVDAINNKERHIIPLSVTSSKWSLSDWVKHHRQESINNNKGE